MKIYTRRSSRDIVWYGKSFLNLCTLSPTMSSNTLSFSWSVIKENKEIYISLSKAMTEIFYTSRILYLYILRLV